MSLRYYINSAPGLVNLSFTAADLLFSSSSLLNQFFSPDQSGKALKHVLNYITICGILRRFMADSPPHLQNCIILYTAEQWLYQEAFPGANPGIRKCGVAPLSTAPLTSWSTKQENQTTNHTIRKGKHQRPVESTQVHGELESQAKTTKQA